MSKQKSTSTSKKSSSQIEDPCCVCGEESDVGCHGYKDGQIYDIYYCNSHYHAQTTKTFSKEKEPEVEEELVEEKTVLELPKKKKSKRANKEELVQYYVSFYEARLRGKSLQQV